MHSIPEENIFHKLQRVTQFSLTHPMLAPNDIVNKLAQTAPRTCFTLLLNGIAALTVDRKIKEKFAAIFSINFLMKRNFWQLGEFFTQLTETIFTRKLLCEECEACRLTSWNGCQIETPTIDFCCFIVWTEENKESDQLESVLFSLVRISAI